METTWKWLKRAFALLAALPPVVGFGKWLEPLLKDMDLQQFRMLELGFVAVVLSLTVAGVFEIMEHCARKKEYEQLRDDFYSFMTEAEVAWDGNDVTVLGKTVKGMYPPVRRLSAHFRHTVEGAPD